MGYKQNIKSVVKDNILTAAYIQAGFRERDCMDNAREINVFNQLIYVIIRFHHNNGYQFADYNVTDNRWVG